jgi:FtsP/CotA-like multicopper oxidase with cupredoxin domain
LGGALVAVTLGFAACTGSPALPPPATSGQPDGWDQQVSLPSTPNLSQAPHTIEVNIEARVASLQIKPGVTTSAWTYNGSIPGPLIRAHVGDHLIVHFTNSLPEDSTIHWHGIRLPAAMDGVPGHTQPAVKTGGTFKYEFDLPDAGLFWYHPHVDSAAQVGDGLYGAILVEEPADALSASPVFGDEVVLVLSDIDITANGSLGDPQYGGDFGTLFGRMGSTLLVNGRVQPKIRATPGVRQRWRIVNAAKTRYFQLALDGHTFTRIGGDGGLIGAPETSDKILVIPGGRTDVVFTPQGQPGTTSTVRWVPYDRGYGTTYMIPEQKVFDVEFVDGAAPNADALPGVLRTIAPIDTATAKARSIELTQDLSTGKLVLGINGVPASQAQALEAHVNDTEVWTITNNMDFDHPFHLHGFFFQPLDSQTGAALASPEWLDTYNVPQHAKVQLVVKYDDRAGMWMFHCHILDHADAGMMGMLMLSQ